MQFCHIQTSWTERMSTRTHTLLTPHVYPTTPLTSQVKKDDGRNSGVHRHAATDSAGGRKPNNSHKAEIIPTGGISLCVSETL